MIPGPIWKEVLQAMGMATMSHVVQILLKFSETVWAYERSLKSLQANHLSLGNGHAGYGYDGCQPHWKGNVLVISSGYFGNRFKDILDRYGANTTILEAPLGENVPLEVIELELKPNIIKL
jgi:alanine-glyoxylate transaminase/serine-glyoxylate transaminase/serine-pyruvate transaminase